MWIKCHAWRRDYRTRRRNYSQLEFKDYKTFPTILASEMSDSISSYITNGDIIYRTSARQTSESHEASGDRKAFSRTDQRPVRLSRSFIEIWLCGKFSELKLGIRLAEYWWSNEISPAYQSNRGLREAWVELKFTTHLLPSYHEKISDYGSLLHRFLTISVYN